MKKQEVIQQFCALASMVGGEVFGHTIPHDCFCDPEHFSGYDFRFDPKVFEFIEQAVQEKIGNGVYDD